MLSTMQRKRQQILRESSIVLANLAFVAGITVLAVLGLEAASFGLLLVSKWQVLLGKPKRWPANLRANGSDIIVGFSLVLLIVEAPSLLMQLVYASLYGLWLIGVKPLSSRGWVAVQAGWSQFFGLFVLFIHARDLPGLVIMAIAWLIAYISAWHMFAQHDNRVGVVPWLWSLFVAQAAWLFWRWNILYSVAGGDVLVPQAAIIVGSIGFVFGTLYLDHQDKKLDRQRLLQYLALMFVMLTVIVLRTDWQAGIT